MLFALTAGLSVLVLYMAYMGVASLIEGLAMGAQGQIKESVAFLSGMTALFSFIAVAIGAVGLLVSSNATHSRHLAETDMSWVGWSALVFVVSGTICWLTDR